MRIFARLINVRFILFAVVMLSFVSVLPALAASETISSNWGSNTTVISLQGGAAGGVFHGTRENCYYYNGQVKCRVIRMVNTHQADTDFVAWKSGVIVALGRNDTYLHWCNFDAVRVNMTQVRCVNPQG